MCYTVGRDRLRPLRASPLATEFKQDVVPRLRNRNNTVDKYIYKMSAEIFTVINVKLFGCAANNFKMFIVLSLAKGCFNVNDDSEFSFIFFCCRLF